jgi:N-methylhydantoinase B
VTAPPRSILHALPPAPVAARHILGHFLPGAIFGALSKALPDRVIAEGAANIWNLQFTGRDLKDEPFTYVWFSCGGTGARPTKDGLHATAFPSGISGVPAEVIEQLSPIVVHKREIRADSAGPGRFRGGCGQTLEVGVRTNRPYLFAPLFDRLHYPAAGYAGGAPGATASITLSTGEELKSKGSRELSPETRITLELPGGGGFFDPLSRDPAAVLADVESGLVSRDAARKQYGIVVKDNKLEIDDKATERVRLQPRP